jgi:hypothetical protein
MDGRSLLFLNPGKNFGHLISVGVGIYQRLVVSNLGCAVQLRNDASEDGPAM